MQRVRLYGHYERSQFITDEMLMSSLDAARAEVHDLLNSKYGDDYFTTSSGITLQQGQTAYTLPADFLKLLGVDYQGTTEHPRSVRRYNWQDRNRYAGPTFSTDGSPDFYYRLQGQTLTLTDAPAGGTLTVTYIPHSPRLTTPDQAVEGFNGWEDLMCWMALRRCQVREETSTTEVDREIARQLERLEWASDARDAGEAETLQDVRSPDGWQRW